MTRLAFATLAFGLAAIAGAQEAPTLLENPAFKQADKNGDGRINRQESEAVDGLDFTRADANEDRVLSRQEFAAAMARGDGLPSFALADKNGDGKVDRKEAREIGRLNFPAADADHDQTLNPTEFRMAMLGSGRRG